ncbi:MAG: prepilin peptidase [Eubacteriales bacterium]|nr:prepilin peptidase [Eubacteriales bacterium]
MVFISIGIALVLVAVIITDYRSHMICNSCIAALIILGSARAFLQGGAQGVIIRILLLGAVFLLCVMIGYYYKAKKNIDAAGGGDFKLIASFALLFGLKGLLLCLLMELAFETVYRYVIYPERRSEALPMGTSIGIFGILILIAERFL